MDEEVLKGKTLLVVDDENDLRDIVASELEFMGAKVYQAENISVAQKLLQEHEVDLIISDIRMPGGTGVDLLDKVKSKGLKAPPVILITGFADITVEDAFNKGAEALINKPFKLDDLIKLVVRYTSPIDERFHETVDAQKTIRINDSSIEFGRGGLAVPIEADRRIDVGEVVNFDFNLHKMHFTGQGICRWVRSIDHSAHRAVVGIEFLNLENDTLRTFKDLFDGKYVVPYIPSPKAQSLNQ